MIVNNINALKNASPSPSDIYTVLGYYQPADGGGGDFYWDPASSENDNNGTIIQLQQGGAGRFKRLFSGALNVKWFGAKGNNTQDDTTYIQSAIDTAAQSGSGGVFVPAGVYLIKAHVDGSGGTYLQDAGGIAMQDNVQLRMDSSAVLKAISNDRQQYQVIRAYNKQNILIEGGKIQGDRDTHTGTGGEWGYGIGILGSVDVIIRNITCYNCWGDGINLQVTTNTGQTKHPQNILIENAVCDNNRRQGMSIEGGINITLANSTFSNTNGTAPQCGIDVEPWSDDNRVENLTITGCNFVGNKHAGLWLFSEALNNAKITKCNFVDNQSGEAHILTQKNPHNVVISECYFNKSTRALQMMGASDFVIANNIFDDCGLQIGHAFTPLPVHRITVIGNSFYGKTTGKNISVGSEAVTSDLYVINNLFDASALASKNGGIIYNRAINFQFRGNTVINFENGLNLAEGSMVENNTFHSCATVTVNLRSGSVFSQNIIHGSGFNSSNTGLGCIHLDDAANSNVIIRNNTIFQQPKYLAAEKTTMPAAAITIRDAYQLNGSEFINNTIVNDSSDAVLPMLIEVYYNGFLYNKTNLVTRSQNAFYCTITGNRPLNKHTGDAVYDTAIGKAIWWNGSNWVDASGATV